MNRGACGCEHILGHPEQPGLHSRLVPAHERPTKSNDKNVVYQIFEIARGPASRRAQRFTSEACSSYSCPEAPAGRWPLQDRRVTDRVHPILLRDIHLIARRRRPYRLRVDYATRAAEKRVRFFCYWLTRALSEERCSCWRARDTQLVSLKP